MFDLEDGCALLNLGQDEGAIRVPDLQVIPLHVARIQILLSLNHIYLNYCNDLLIQIKDLKYCSYIRHAREVIEIGFSQT